MSATDRSKICGNCGKRFYNPYGLGIKQWRAKKYCSAKCFGLYDSLIRKKIYQDKTKHPRWKGDNVGYFALHDWVEKILGKPKKCEVCGLDNQEKMYHWANLSHKYYRKVDDWKRMCVSCHRKYDNAARRLQQQSA